MDWDTQWDTQADIWWGSVYDQYETQTDDVEMLIDILGEPKNVLEVCCGTGRILVPLAKAGHTVTGFDRSEGMLARLPAKIGGLTNLHYYKADAGADDWGSGYDVVVLAGNIMINIEGADDYKQAQELFIRKAADALKVGGYIYLDYDQWLDQNAAKKFFTSEGGASRYAGTSGEGVVGHIIGGGGQYDIATQMAWSENTQVLTLPDGTTHEMVRKSSKHIPTLEQVHKWLDDAGFAIEQEYGGRDKKPIDLSGEYARAIIYAVKK